MQTIDFRGNYCGQLRCWCEYWVGKQRTWFGIEMSDYTWINVGLN